MGGRRVCEICGIKESRRAGFFASFPIDEYRCRIWVKVVGKEDLAYLPIEKLHSVRSVCGDHFERRDFSKKGNRLRKTAYPKLNLFAAPLTAEQMKDFPLHVASKTVSAPVQASPGPGTGTPQVPQELTLDQDNFNDELPEMSEDICVETSKNDQIKHDRLPKSTTTLRKVEPNIDYDELESYKLPMTIKKKLKYLKNENDRLKTKIKTLKQRLSKSQKFEKVMEKMTEPAKLLTRMQFEGTKKDPKGRRYNMEEKELALAMYSQQIGIMTHDKLNILQTF